jgi:hypothetical protein
MATGDGIVCKLDNISEIEGADKIVQASIFGETVIVAKDVPEGTLGVLFDLETQLAPEFLHNNNLYRHENLNKDVSKKGYFNDNGRVRPIRLKGVKVSGFWVTLDYLNYLDDLPELKENAVISDKRVCSRYMPKHEKTVSAGAKSPSLVPMFKEHFETEQLLRTLRDVPVGDFVITAKLHGTSCRYGKVKQEQPLTWWEKLFNVRKPEKWVNVAGSRRVVKSIHGESVTDKHYYDDDMWTRVASITFGDRLLKGETVYFEIVGYTEGSPIMPSHSTTKLKDLVSKDEYKNIVSQFGETIFYSYGCLPFEWDIYVYRITQTNEDGDSIDLSWAQVKQRCEKLGVKHVPEFTTGRKITPDVYEIRDGSGVPIHYTDNRDFSDAIEGLAGNAIHNNTFPEGICLRSESYPTCKIWKHKCRNFKLLEFGQRDDGIVTQDEVN